MFIKKMTKNYAAALCAALLCLSLNLCNISFAQDTLNLEAKYPDYSYEFLGKDKFENFNRKVFILNSNINKYAIRPVHRVWASVMPKYGMERLQNVSTNIEYPKRLISALIQRDFKVSKTETLRFLANTTIGIGGLYDPALKYFKIEPVKEDMERALMKLKMRRGPYLVIPIMSSSSPRAVLGKILDAGLDPTSYVGTPILALVKAGLLINKTSDIQPLSKLIESTYADPYDIAKKLYGLENYIKSKNYDRREVLEAINANDAGFVGTSSINTDTDSDILSFVDGQEKFADKPFLKGAAPNVLKSTPSLKPDILLPDYYPQGPFADSTRTALFDLPGINDSIWSELSVWNRCFAKQIKTSSISVDPSRDDYKFRYILQKDKKAPVAILIPSIGEGANAHHSTVLAKLFHEEGYSVIMVGNTFQWEFAKSMPKNYKPGIPSDDVDCLKLVTSEILFKLKKKYDFDPREKVVVGTSLGAFTTLVLADSEKRNNTLDISKYISINPPIEVIFSLDKLDKSNEEWKKSPSDLKEKAAITAAKTLQVLQAKDLTEIKTKGCPLSDDEAKLITAFIMRQKLSDLIFTIEETPKSHRTDIYASINNMSYNDYMEKYLLNTEDGKYKTKDELYFDASLHSIEDYLRNSDNYKIYHAQDDYLVNQTQLEQLKEYSGKNTVIVSNGSHLGYLYREEFINELRKDISLKNKGPEEEPQEVVGFLNRSK